MLEPGQWFYFQESQAELSSRQFEDLPGANVR